MAPGTFQDFMNDSDSDDFADHRAPAIKVTPPGGAGSSGRANRPQSAAIKSGRSPVAPPSPPSTLGPIDEGGGKSSKKKHRHDHSLTSLGPVDELQSRSRSPQPGERSRRDPSADGAKHSLTSLGPVEGLRNRSVSPAPLGDARQKRKDQPDKGFSGPPLALGGGGNRPPSLGAPLDGLRGRSQSPMPSRGAPDPHGGSQQRSVSRSRDEEKREKKEKKEKKSKKEKKESKHIEAPIDLGEDSLDELSAAPSTFAPRRLDDDDDDRKERKSKKDKKGRLDDDDLSGHRFVESLDLDEEPSVEKKSRKERKSKRHEELDKTPERPKSRAALDDSFEDLTGDVAPQGKKEKKAKKEKKERRSDRHHDAPAFPEEEEEEEACGSELDLDEAPPAPEKKRPASAKPVPPRLPIGGARAEDDDDMMSRLSGAKPSAPSGASSLRRPKTAAGRESKPNGPVTSRFLLKLGGGPPLLGVEQVNAGGRPGVEVIFIPDAQAVNTPSGVQELFDSNTEKLFPQYKKQVEAVLKHLQVPPLYTVTAPGGVAWTPRLAPADSWRGAPQPKATLPQGTKLLVRARARRPDGWWLNLEGYGGWVNEGASGNLSVERWSADEKLLRQWLQQAQQKLGAAPKANGLQAKTMRAAAERLQAWLGPDDDELS